MGGKKSLRTAGPLSYLMLVNAVSPSRFVKKGVFLAAVVLKPLWAASGIFEDQGAAIAERDVLGLPIRALVEALGLCAGGVPFLVEPVQVRFVVGNAPAAFMRRMMKTRSGGGSGWGVYHWGGGGLG